MANRGNFFAFLDGEEVEDVSSLVERLEEKKKIKEKIKKKLEAQTQQKKHDSRQSNNSAANSRSASYNGVYPKGRGKEGYSRGPGKNMEGSGRRQPISSQSNRAPLNGHQGNGVTNGHQWNYGQDNGYYADSSNGNYRSYDNNYQQVNRQAWQAGHGDQYDNAQYKGNRQDGRMGYGGDGNGRQQSNGWRIYVERQQSNGGRDYSGDGRFNGWNYHNGNQSKASVTSEDSRSVKPEGEDRERFSWKRLVTMPDEEREAFFKTKAEKATENSFWTSMQKKTAEERKACCKTKFEEEEAEKKKKTLKEYEKELLEKLALFEASKTKERKVTIDKELELMQPMGKKREENVLDKLQLKKDGTKSKDGDNKDEKRRAMDSSSSSPKSAVIPYPFSSSTALMQTPVAKSNTPMVLPEKFDMLCKFLKSLITSIQLLKLKRSMSTFTNIVPVIKCLTDDRRFTYSHLAQLKFLLPQAIEIKKILVHDEQTSFMKPELHVTLNFDAVENDLELKSNSASLKLLELFHSRVLILLGVDPEMDEVPEDKLPEPFNLLSRVSSANLIKEPNLVSVHETASYEPASVATETALLPVSKPLPDLCFTKEGSCVSNDPSPSPSPVKWSSTLPKTPIKSCDLKEKEDISAKGATPIDGTPSKLVSTPSRATLAQALARSAKCFVTPDDDSMKPPTSILVGCSSGRRSTTFDTPMKSEMATTEKTYVGDEICDILPEIILELVKLQSSSDCCKN